MFASVYKAPNSVKSKRLESVTVTLGFQGPVDLDSGMIISLTDVDVWIDRFKLKVAQKSFSSRVDFCKKNKETLKKLIPRSDLVQILFSFHDFFVFYKDKDVLFGWLLVSELSNESTTWLSPITLTFSAGKSDLAKWISKNESNNKKMWLKTKIKNNKVVGVKPFIGARFHSLECQDPAIDSKIKFYENDIILK